MTEKKALGAQEWIAQTEPASGWSVGRFLQTIREEGLTDALAECLAAYAASLADSTMPLLKRIYDHLTGPPKESDFTLARELRDFLADSPSPTAPITDTAENFKQIHEIPKGCAWRAWECEKCWNIWLTRNEKPKFCPRCSISADSPSGTAAPPKTEASK
jgi:hypothetical protein